MWSLFPNISDFEAHAITTVLIRSAGAKSPLHPLLLHAKPIFCLEAPEKYPEKNTLLVGGPFTTGIHTCE